ncbi:response regulator [Pseudomonadota bacterium]
MVDTSMMDLFRMEVEQQCATLNEALLVLDESPKSPEPLESAMRASHSLKGAAKLIDVQIVVKLAHEMEDCLVAAQNAQLNLTSSSVDHLLAGMDLIRAISDNLEELESWQKENQATYDQLIEALKAVLSDDQAEEASPQMKSSVAVVAAKPESAVVPAMQDLSMLELFKVEAEQQTAVLSAGLLELEQDATSPERLEPLMRAAHSIKGAAKLIGLQFAVELAHTMEDVFVASQNGELLLVGEYIDVLLKGVDMINEISASGDECATWFESSRTEYDALIKNLNEVLKGESPTVTDTLDALISQEMPEATPSNADAGSEQKEITQIDDKKSATPPKERVLRVSADQLNRLMGLAGESLVESRWLYPYAESLLRLKRQQTDLVCMMDNLRERLDYQRANEDVQSLVRSAQRQASHCREMMADRLAELESYDRRSTNLSSRLHREVVQSRMRPFGDGVHGFPRMVRDIARALKKDVQLVIDGASTLVDRDILDKIEAPLNHLIRNAIDHGMEMPEERKAVNKQEKGVIKLYAYHHAGMLSIVVEDDGRGVDLERLRQKVIDKGLVDQSMSETLSDSELLDFLFLPSFSTKDQVSEISGRGVGLDVVHDVVNEMRGNVRAISTFGEGTKFHLQLPLTLSVIPALIVEVAEEPFAFPLARIDRILRISPDVLEEAEGNQFVRIDDRNIGLVNAGQILEKTTSHETHAQLHVVVLNERHNYYGMVVDKFLGERELVVQVMPSILGKVQDISSAALMEDGSPVLIVDVDDLIRSIEKVLRVARLSKIKDVEELSHSSKRVLVIDDSLTVREVERKLLEGAGYLVETAVDGIDGLNVLRGGTFDLLITDVDMPRMNGLDLVRTVRQDPSLREIPVMMVSYKDRDEDRIRGMEAGADYYLTKGSFHDESLREAVVDLIGVADS